MKARIKATGEVWPFSQIDEITFKSAMNGHLYCVEELEFLEPSVFSPDYWTRLEHQAAIEAMQAYIIVSHISQFSFGECDKDMKDCKSMAHALVEKLKEKEEK